MTSIGIPKGYLDYTLNFKLNYEMEKEKVFKPVLAVQGSISNRHNGTGTRILSSYALINVMAKPMFLKLRPYVSGGIGYHVVMSVSNGEGTMGSLSRTDYHFKQHFFFGVKLDVFRNSVLFIETRLTLPGSPVLDSGYFGFGFFL